MAQQQSEHAEALRAAQMTNKSLESAQMIVSSELRRLTARVRTIILLWSFLESACFLIRIFATFQNLELATINNHLQEEVQGKRTAVVVMCLLDRIFYFLQPI